MTLFKGGILVSGQGITLADLRVEGDRIREVAPCLTARTGEKVVDISGKLLLPGIIDAHTHFSLQARNTVTADDVYSGGVSAACGGVTTVIDYANQLPNQSLLEGINSRHKDFSDSVVDYSFHLVVNDYYTPEQAGQFAELISAGITSIKMFTTYREAGYLLSQEKWRSVLEACADAGLLVTVHAEDDIIVEESTRRGKNTGRTEPKDHPDLRPAQAEVTAVQNLIGLAETTGCPIYIVHLSTGGACRLVWEARERRLPVLSETAPHYLLLGRNLLEGPDGRNHLMTPPLREYQDNRILWQGVADGTISVIATDHCAYTPEQKAQGKDALDILPGIPGVETLLPLIYTHGVAEGRIDLPRMVQLLAENPARIFGLWPRKGNLVPGADADLVVYNPDSRTELADSSLHSRAGYTSFAGMNIRGRVELTMLRGNILVQDGNFTGGRGLGRFVPGHPGGK